MSTNTAPQKKKRRKRATEAYPKNSLMDALRIAESIRDNSAGKPYSRLDLAKSLGYSPSTGSFRTLITSSTRYGLTTGSYGAKTIKLTPLGTSIMYPQNPDEKANGLKKALFNIELFKRFFSDYDNSKLPSVEYLTNTLNRTYGIPIEDCKKCYAMIVKNAKELGILDNISGSEYIRLDKLAKTQNVPSAPVSEVETPEIETPEGETPEEVAISPSEPCLEKPTVFISHSKNITIVDQIKTILEFGDFEYKIAEEKETTAIPIPEKVFGLMKQCNCAIINVSADEQEKREDGTYGVNANVLTEIGGAFLRYDRKVILLVDKRVELPSNLQGL